MGLFRYIKSLGFAVTNIDQDVYEAETEMRDDMENEVRGADGASAVSPGDVEMGGVSNTNSTAELIPKKVEKPPLRASKWVPPSQEKAE